MAKDTGTQRIEYQLTKLHEKLEANNVMTTDIRICIGRIQEHLKSLNEKVTEHSQDIITLTKDMKQIDKDVTNNRVLIAKATGGGAVVGSGATGIVILILKMMGWI